jgi:ABC-2 type transport system permease protein
VLASIFGLIFHDVTSGRVTFAFALVDQDRARPRGVSNAGTGAARASGLITVHREPAWPPAAARLTRAPSPPRSCATTGIRRGGPVATDVVGDVDALIGAQVAESIAQSFASRIETDRVARAALGPSAPSPQELGAGPLDTRGHLHEGRQFDVGTFYAAGMAVFFLFLTVQFGISSVLDERRDGTLARMLVARSGAARSSAASCHERRARRREHGRTRRHDALPARGPTGAFRSASRC